MAFCPISTFSKEIHSIAAVAIFSAIAASTTAAIIAASFATTDSSAITASAAVFIEVTIASFGHHHIVAAISIVAITSTIATVSTAVTVSIAATAAGAFDLSFSVVAGIAFIVVIVAIAAINASSFIRHATAKSIAISPYLNIF